MPYAFEIAGQVMVALLLAVVVYELIFTKGD